MFANQARRQRTNREARWDAEKQDAAGEGSRGGRVIGHTSSGKPIYANHGHVSHGSFSSKDHGEAANLHMKLMQRSADIAASTEHSSTHNKQSKQADHHESQMKKHGESQRFQEERVKKPVTPQVPSGGIGGGKQMLALRSR